MLGLLKTGQNNVVMGAGPWGQGEGSAPCLDNLAPTVDSEALEIWDWVLWENLAPSASMKSMQFIIFLVYHVSLIRCPITSFKMKIQLQSLLQSLCFT